MSEPSEDADKVVHLFGAPDERSGECLESDGDKGDSMREGLLQVLDNLREQVASRRIRSLAVAFVTSDNRAGSMMAFAPGGVPAQLGSLRVAEARLISIAGQYGEV